MVGKNTPTYTVASIMDRLKLQFLTPPDAEDVLIELGADITTTTQSTITLGGFLIPEDEALMRQGLLIEAGQELMRVMSYDANAGTVVVKRNQQGTIASTYTAGEMLTLSPSYSRATIFEAVADNIRLLSPKLFTVGEEYTVEVAERAYVLEDDLAVEVIEVMSPDNTFSFDNRGQLGRIVDFHPETRQRTYIAPYSWGDIWVKYRRKMGQATDETDTLDDLGVDRDFVQIVIAGAAADLLAGRELPAVHTEWIQSTLEAQSIEPGRRISIAGSLRQYRNTLLRDAAQTLDNEYGISMDIADPLSQFFVSDLPGGARL